MAAAAERAAALVGAGESAESTLAAEVEVGPDVAPATAGRNKRSAACPAPASQPAAPQQQAAQPLRLQQLAVDGADSACTQLGCAATPGTATPAPATVLALSKRQRMLLLTGGVHRSGGGGAATPGATPGSGVGSNSKVQPKAARRVARDLSFTPAPPPHPENTGAQGAACRGGGTCTSLACVT